MKKSSSSLERLLRSAASVPSAEPEEMPFGFDTRVLALASIQPGSANGGIASLVRRVAIAAACVTALATAGVYWQAAGSDDPYDGEDYAFAETEIQSTFLP